MPINSIDNNSSQQSNLALQYQNCTLGKVYRKAQELKKNNIFSLAKLTQELRLKSRVTLLTRLGKYCIDANDFDLSPADFTKKITANGFTLDTELKAKSKQPLLTTIASITYAKLYDAIVSTRSKAAATEKLGVTIHQFNFISSHYVKYIELKLISSSQELSKHIGDINRSIELNTDLSAPILEKLRNLSPEKPLIICRSRSEAIKLKAAIVVYLTEIINHRDFHPLTIAMLKDTIQLVRNFNFHIAKIEKKPVAKSIRMTRSRTHSFFQPSTATISVDEIMTVLDKEYGYETQKRKRDENEVEVDVKKQKKSIDITYNNANKNKMLLFSSVENKQTQLKPLSTNFQVRKRNLR